MCQTLTTGEKNRILIALFFAKREIVQSFLDILFSLMVPFMAYFILCIFAPESGEMEILPSEEALRFLLLAFIGFSCLDFICKSLKNRHLMILQRQDMPCKKCQCDESKLITLQYLMWMHYSIEYIDENRGRLEIACPGCKKILYACDIKEDGLFEFILK